MPWTMRKTFPDSQDDFVILVDGEPAGRIMKVQRSFGRVAWFWTLRDLVPPGLGVGHGDADTLEDAKTAFRSKYERVKMGGGRTMKRAN